MASATLARLDVDAADRQLIRGGFHPGFLPKHLCDDLWEYTLSREPYFVKFRGHNLVTRPKINFGDPNEHGEYPLYRWGQEKQSYDRIEKIPPPVRAVMDFIRERFGVQTNLAMATYYYNGRDHYIPAHQDKRVSLASEGRVENSTQIFNISLGAVRPFLVTTLGCLGKSQRADLEIVEEFLMRPGDLYALEPRINEHFGHAVARDPAVKELRVSWVFRTVDACWVDPEQKTFREAGKKHKMQPITGPNKKTKHA